MEKFNMENLGINLSSIIFDESQDVIFVLKNGLEVTLENGTKGIITNYSHTTATFTLGDEIITHMAYEVIVVVEPSKILWIRGGRR